MKIINHVLESSIYRQTPNLGELLEPKGIVIHYTAGASAMSSVNWLTSKDSEVSAHLIIGRDGSIYQLSKFNRVCWHAGISKYKNLANLNNYTIGIELDNMGLLKVIGKNAVYTPNGTIVKDVTWVKGQPWHNYTTKQLDSLKEVAKCIIATYPISFVIGHNEAAPTRKIDPGALFDMAKFRKEVGIK